MNLYFVSQIVQIIVSVFLTLLVLMQAKGTGLTSAIGGNIGFYRSRRGLEKAVLVLTILTSAIFVLNSLYLVLNS